MSPLMRFFEYFVFNMLFLDTCLTIFNLQYSIYFVKNVLINYMSKTKKHLQMLFLNTQMLKKVKEFVILFELKIFERIFL